MPQDYFDRVKEMESGAGPSGGEAGPVGDGLDEAVADLNALSAPTGAPEGDLGGDGLDEDLGGEAPGIGLEPAALAEAMGTDEKRAEAIIEVIPMFPMLTDLAEAGDAAGIAEMLDADPNLKGMVLSEAMKADMSGEDGMGDLDGMGESESLPEPEAPEPAEPSKNLDKE